jgi:hypothetical protein
MSWDTASIPRERREWMAHSDSLRKRYDALLNVDKAGEPTVVIRGRIRPRARCRRLSSIRVLLGGFVVINLSRHRALRLVCLDPGQLDLYSLRYL